MSVCCCMEEKTEEGQALSQSFGIELVQVVEDEPAKVVSDREKSSAKEFHGSALIGKWKLNKIEVISIINNDFQNVMKTSKD